METNANTPGRATVAPRWNRSPVFCFEELALWEQAAVLADANTRQHAVENRYVYFNTKDGHEVLPLDMFARTEHSKVWHGMYGTSYFSAYFIRLNRTGEEALVAEKFS